ncbi:DUF1801 domain-containing protein [Croceiramulus getboli]|nr:DUF1801 domain-containing protein [Flavobacteriaceae bacterium YJPT1-3]
MNPAQAYILNAPEPYKTIMLQLQMIIESTVPGLDLRFKWNVPFFYLNKTKTFCFLKHKKDYIDLGLPYGYRLDNKHNQLIAGGNRKNLRSLRYYKPEDIDEQLLRDTLEELHEIRKRK